MNGLKMKSVIFYMILMAASTCLWGCGSDEPGPAVVPEPKWELDLVEDEPVPAWKAPESGIYQFSMTAIIRLSDFLEKYADPADEISAFVGDECRGIATVQENGTKLFFLYIRGNSGEAQKVTLNITAPRIRRRMFARIFWCSNKTGRMARYPIRQFLRSKSPANIRKR